MVGTSSGASIGSNGSGFGNGAGGGGVPPVVGLPSPRRSATAKAVAALGYDKTTRQQVTDARSIVTREEANMQQLRVGEQSDKKETKTTSWATLKLH